MDQEFKSEGQCQGHKISIFKKSRKTGILADLNRSLHEKSVLLKFIRGCK